MVLGIQISDLFDLEKTIAAEIFENRANVWEVLPDIKSFILKLGATLDLELYEKRGEDIWISKSADVFPSAYIAGPCIIEIGRASCRERV